MRLPWIRRHCLPPEQELYQKIRQQYKVAFEPLQLGQIRLNLLTDNGPGTAAGGQGSAEESVGFSRSGSGCGRAAIVLAQYLAGQQFAKGTRLLELGAGLGAPGLAAAAAGCSVTLTDYEEQILDFERISAAASRLEDVRFEILDWKNPPEMEQYDIIVGAEILFREEFFEPLLRFMRKALKPGGSRLSGP